MTSRSFDWGSVAFAFAVGLAAGVIITDKPAPQFSCEGGIVETPYAELEAPDEPNGEWLSDLIVFSCSPPRDQK